MDMCIVVQVRDKTAAFCPLLKICTSFLIKIGVNRVLSAYGEVLLCYLKVRMRGVQCLTDSGIF